MAKAQRGGAATAAAVAEPDPPVFDPAEDPETQEMETARQAQEELERRQPRSGQKFSAHQDTTDFWEWLRSRTDGEWQQLEFYLYRKAPVTDRLAGGNPVKYVTKYGQGVDLETIKREHGSGIYKALVNQLALTSGKESSKTIRQLTFEIEDTNYPPKVPPGEWVDDPRNKRWAWAKPADPAAPGAAAASGLAGAADLLRVALDAVAKLRPEQRDDKTTVTTAIVEAMKAAQAQTFELVKDREKPAGWTPQEIVAMATLLIPLLRPPAPESNAVVEVLRAQLTAQEKQNQEMREEMRELRKELRGGGDGAGGGILKAVREARLVERILKGDQEPMDWKAMGMQMLGEQLPRITELLAARRGVSLPPAERTLPPAPHARANPGANAPPAGAPGADTGAAPEDPQMAEAIDVIRAYGPYILNAFVQNATGADFALSVINLIGWPDYRKIANLGVERFMLAIQADPQFVRDVGGGRKQSVFAGLEEQLLEFVEDFVKGPSDEEYEEPEPAAPPAAAKGPRPVPRKKAAAEPAAAAAAPTPAP